MYTIRLRSQEVLEEVPDAPEMAREVLMAHALMRHARLHGDESRSALVILNDSVKAKLLFADDGWVPAEQSSLLGFDGDGWVPAELSTGSSSSSGVSALSAAAVAAIEH